MSDKMRLAVLFVLIIAVVVGAGVFFVSGSPHYATNPISQIIISRDLQKFTDYIRISGRDFTCSPHDGQQWACQVMVEGKLLTMSVDQTGTGTSVTGCKVVYDGQPVRCEAGIGFVSTYVIAHSDLGFSPARMAEIRAQKPHLYWSEATWMALGVAAASLFSFLIVLTLLTLLNKKQAVVVPALRLNVPIWAVCLVAILAAVVLHQATTLLYVCPIGVGGTLLLSIAVFWLNRLDKERGLKVAHPLMWAATSIIVFWVANLGTLFSLLFVGIVD